MLGGIRAMRLAFWEVLVQHVPPDVTIEWGAVVVNVIVAADGGAVTVLLKDERRIMADLVIVADGNHSRVREALLPHEHLRFAGVAIIGGSLRCTPGPERRVVDGDDGDDDDTGVPDIARHRHGMIMSNGDGCALWLAHEETTRVSWGLAIPTTNPMPKPREADTAARAALHAMAQSKLASWPPTVRALIDASDATAVGVVNCFDKLPHGSVAGRVAFIGDSSHPVTPFSGNGAGMAIVDGMRMAECLTDARHATLAAALRSFDAEMIRRAGGVVRGGRWTIRVMMSTSHGTILMRDTVLRILNFALHHPLILAAFIVISVAVAVQLIRGHLFNHP